VTHLDGARKIRPASGLSISPMRAFYNAADCLEWT
jgi:hypothetical protein